MVDGHEQIEVPEKFSVIENPEETIRFAQRLRACFDRGDRPRIDAERVTFLTVDALALLLSLLPKNGRFLGTFPKDPKANALFHESGFLEHVHAHNVKPVERHGLARKATNVLAKATEAQKLIELVTTGLFGQKRRSPGSYKTLIECMNNTRNWAAASDAQEEPWWVLAYYDKTEGRAMFAFVDKGIGILKSANISSRRRLMVKLGLRRRTEILRQLLDGKIPSASSLPNRGLGLPKMKSDTLSGRIVNLRMVTNNVYADVGRDEFRELQGSFKGTLVYWELGATL